MKKTDYLNHYYRLQKNDNGSWWSLTSSNEQSDKPLLASMKKLSIVKTMCWQNIIVQKTGKKRNEGIRLAIGRKTEQRAIGVFKNDTECTALFISHKTKTYAEFFISEKIKNNSFALLQMLEAGELEDEIAYHRLQYQQKQRIINGEKLQNS